MGWPFALPVAGVCRGPDFSQRILDHCALMRWRALFESTSTLNETQRNPELLEVQSHLKVVASRLRQGVFSIQNRGFASSRFCIIEVLSHRGFASSGFCNIDVL
jgi:hypothetical protein